MLPCHGDIAWWQSAGFIFGGLQVQSLAGVSGEFAPLELTFCANTNFSIRSTSKLLQWQVKDYGRSAESAGSRLQLNMHTLFTQRCLNGLTVLSMHSVGTCQGSEFTCILSGNACSQLSQLTESLTVN